MIEKEKITEKKRDIGYKWVIAGVMTLVWFCLGMALFQNVPWIQFYQLDMGIGWIQQGLSLVIAALPLTFVGPLMKAMMKKFGGVKKVIVIDMVIVSLAGLACAFAPEFYTLMIARFIEGIGLFGIFAIGLHMVLPWFGLQNAAKTGPQFALVLLGALMVSIIIMIGMFGSINSIFNFNYHLTQACIVFPIYGITTILAQIFLKEVKH